MDNFDKAVLALGIAFLLIILAFIGVTGYTTYLRAQVINTSPDPLYAACAFDSGERYVPVSCYALITQNKDLPR